jgi:hypothetical protein
MANRNWSNGGKVWTMHTSPVLADCNFVVDNTNGNGLGLRNLKGPTIASAYMHTTATPATGNPNPAPGIIIINFQDNYNRSLTGSSSIVSPVTGSALTAVTANTTYVIGSLGTATTAQLQAIGVILGVTPAVGMPFVAKSTTAVPGGATVFAVGSSGITSIETVGDPNTLISNTQYSTGAQVILQCLNSGTLTAPANGTVISLSFLLSNSSVTVQGE